MAPLADIKGRMNLLNTMCSKPVIALDQTLKPFYKLFYKSSLAFLDGVCFSKLQEWWVYVILICWVAGGARVSLFDVRNHPSIYSIK